MARPPLLTPEKAEEIEGYVREGLSYDDAALQAGVSTTSFYRWKARGMKAKKGKFREFWERLRRARTTYKFSRIRIVNKSAEEKTVEERINKKRIPKGKDENGEPIFEEQTEIVRITRPPDAKAAMWALERFFPREFGRQVTEHAGEVKVDHAGKVDTGVPLFKWPDGSLRTEVPMETPEQVAAAGGRVPDPEEAAKEIEEPTDGADG